MSWFSWECLGRTLAITLVIMALVAYLQSGYAHHPFWVTAAAGIVLAILFPRDEQFSMGQIDGFLVRVIILFTVFLLIIVGTKLFLMSEPKSQDGKYAEHQSSPVFVVS